MANRYGEAALMAARQGASAGTAPLACWESAMEKLYPTSPVARKVGGPRGAFLGLCEEGLVKGISAGQYAAPRESKDYAVRAVALLAEGGRSWSTSALWEAVSNAPGKKHNSSMDVVMALWKNDLILRRA
jgi:hypothetical protein